MPMTLTAITLDTQYNVTKSAVTTMSERFSLSRFLKGFSDTLFIRFIFSGAKLLIYSGPGKWSIFPRCY